MTTISLETISIVHGKSWLLLRTVGGQYGATQLDGEGTRAEGEVLLREHKEDAGWTILALPPAFAAALQDIWMDREKTAQVRHDGPSA